jgi:hypothetical protein
MLQGPLAMGEARVIAFGYVRRVQPIAGARLMEPR